VGICPLGENPTVAVFIDADVTNTLDEFDDSIETILVTKDLDADAPSADSVIETVSLGIGFENIHSDIASTTVGGDVISDTW
jgi:hypothetical protein